VERVGTAAQRVHFYQSRILLNNRENRYRISDETMQLVERTLEAAEETGVPAEAALSTFIAGFCSLWRGDLDRSEKFLKLSLSQILRVGDAVLQSRCLTYLTVLYRKRTRVEEASSYAERSLELATSINMQEYVAAARANLGWLKWRANEIMESKDLCSEALQIWRSLPLVSPFQELALWPLIGIALQENELKEACRHASFILDPTQRQLDPEFEDLLRSAVQSPPEKARQLLEQAARVAKSEGYL
jgi:tetratricopeptide (TPR) repeat protein